MTLIDTLIGLVDTPSETGNEGRLCTALAERLMRTHGQQAVRRIGNSLVVGRRTDRPMVLLVGHIDTVPFGPEDQWQYPPLSGTVVDGRIWGRGSVDNRTPRSQDAKGTSASP